MNDFIIAGVASDGDPAALKSPCAAAAAVVAAVADAAATRARLPLRRTSTRSSTPTDKLVERKKKEDLRVEYRNFML